MLDGNSPLPHVEAFFDEATFTASYVVHDPVTLEAAIIDSVLDFEQSSHRMAFNSADRIIAFVTEKGLKVRWILETHSHADHLSAAPYLEDRLGGELAIGAYMKSRIGFSKRASVKEFISSLSRPCGIGTKRSARSR